MRYALIAVLAGCGGADDKPIDAPRSDAPGTCSGNTVEACGATCEACSVTSDREQPVCDGTACSAACKGGAPDCTDGSCSRLLWTFESGMVDGITPRAPAGLQLAVRSHLGSQAMAVDVASLTEISFRLPVCLSGTVDMRGKMVTLGVFFEGGDPNGEQYFTQVTVPDPTGALVGQRGVQAGMAVTFTGTIPSTATTQMTSEVTVQAGTFGAPFAGTIWFDNITVQ